MAVAKFTETISVYVDLVGKLLLLKMSNGRRDRSEVHELHSTNEEVPLNTYINKPKA